MMDFYSGKSKELPRFVYRNLIAELDNVRDAGARNKVVDKFCDFLEELKHEEDWHKLKWCMSDKLAQILLPEEKQRIEEILSAKRKKRNERMLAVYPQCSDEYSTNIEFLDSAFGSTRTQIFDQHTKIFTIGSCFANNIARYLSKKGYNTTSYVQQEDLNSPFSNAKMLSVCAAPDEQRNAYIEYWVKLLYPEDADHKSIIANEIEKLDKLASQIKASELLIITYGNVIDYFLTGEGSPFERGPAVAPKFLSISANEDVDQRSALTQKLKKSGVEFRIGSYSEVRSAVDSLYAAVRAINPQAKLLMTLSPIPIDSALGTVHTTKRGAIEIDCISKSLLRSALYEFMEQNIADEKLFYFPSFEVVRWIAPNMDMAVFGKEDASSRHISQDILNGIYEYFTYKCGSQVEFTPPPSAGQPKKKRKSIFRKIAKLFK